MRTYVLVHGGGHGGWCYQRVARILRSRGHEVYTPTMTGLGERAHLLSPAIDLNMQITDVVKALEFEDLRNVILVGHSLGGVIVLRYLQHQDYSAIARQMQKTEHQVRALAHKGLKQLRTLLVPASDGFRKADLR